MNKAYTIKELQALPDDDLNAMAAELRGFYNHLLAFSLYDTNADGRSVMICTKSDWQPATDRNQSGELLAWAVENGADFMIRHSRERSRTVVFGESLLTVPGNNARAETVAFCAAMLARAGRLT